MKDNISPGPLLGRVLKTQPLPAMTITETSYAPNLSMSCHSHRFPYFCAVLAGSFLDKVDSGDRSCRRSMVYLRPAEQAHEDHFSETGARCLTLELKPALTERLGLSTRLLEEGGQFFGGTVFALSLRLHAELEKWDPFSSLSVEAIALEMICEISRSIPRDPRPLWLSQVIQVLDTEFMQSLSLSEIAKAVHVHPTHLARTFRAAYGCTAGEYVRRKRIQFCSECLADPDLSLSAIALNAGFADQSHFCRAFKSLMGESPGSYRARRFRSRC